MPEPRAGLGAVLLAGGASDRMGEPKALLRLPSIPSRCLLEDQVARLLGAGCGCVAVVLGAEAERIEAALGPLDARTILCRNVEWRRGSFSSLQTGLAALGPCPGGTLVLPVDVPGVPSEVMARLVPGAADAPDAVVPVYGGRGGHPVWLSPWLVARILREAPTARLDRLLASRNVRRVEVDDRRVGENVNTPEDWARFLREWGA